MRVSAVAVALFVFAFSLSAATFDLPTDADLSARADLIVVATVAESAGRLATDGMVLTDYRFRVEQVLKGTARGTITVSEAGGFAEGRGVEIAGAPTYATGSRVLAFLRQRPDGTYYTAFMALGHYRFAKGNQLLVRDAMGIETLSGEPAEVRDAPAFLEAIRSGKPYRAQRLISAADAVRELKPKTNAPASNYVLSATLGPKRWQGCESGCTIGFLTQGIHPVVDNAGGILDAMAAWTNHANSFIALQVDGNDNSKTNQTNDGVNDIVLGWDGTNPHSSCEGAKGCGIVYFGGPGFEHTFRGENFYTVESGDVVIHQSVTNQNAFEAILTHELGHAIAFRHSNEGTPTGGSNNIMHSTVPTSGAGLGPWDEEALTAVYGPGVTCIPIDVTGTTGGGTVTFGATATLGVTVTGDGPRSYQWYEGTTGVTTTPVGTSSTFVTPPITTIRNYWVKVTNGCPSSENSATITVTPAACEAPVIVSGPASQQITPNQTAALSVNATGTSLNYQWYRSGTSGQAVNPVGANSPNFTTPALQTTTSYWVRVSNGCGTQDSAVATVTVSSQCNVPVITAEPQNANINPGQTATLQLTATGTAPLTTRWYQSNTVGDTSVLVATGNSFTTPPLQTTTRYWARVTNNCGHDDSVLVTVTVAPQCVVPTIAAQSGTINLQPGQGATISVTPAGTPTFSYQWYAGAPGDPANPIAGATSSSYPAGPFNTPGTYGFWVLVSNGCGQVGSGPVTINVACPSIPVPIVSSPANTIAASSYQISWTGDLLVAPNFELQEATNADFTANVRTFNVSNALSKDIPAHTEITTDTRFYYRVRAISPCTNQPSAWSQPASTVVTAPAAPTSAQFTFSLPVGTTAPFVQDYLVPGFGETATPEDRFTITADVPWITIFPGSGALSAGGTTVQLTINPAGLGAGSRSANILITRTQPAAAGNIGANGGTTSTGATPFSMSLVTPVSPDPRDSNPPPGTLIIPAVAHVQGIGSPFRSDVRIVNVSFEDIEYEISYTPSQTDGTQTGKKTTIVIPAGETLAFDDIVSSWYGSGMLGEGGLGTIEIRPLNSSNPFSTFAASRTYALDAGGTLGQFIPALRLDAFVANIAQDSLNRISLQQVANSTAYRTNLGFVEGSGTPVDLIARLVDGNNNVLSQTNLSLPAYGQLQRSLPLLFGEIALTDGRVEVEATSSSGKVSAYASVLNNNTNDPLMIFPVQPARYRSGRYVLAGMAEFSSSFSNFHSDMRIYNGGPSTVTAKLEYFERGQTAPRSDTQPIEITLAPGQVRAFNDVLPTLWGIGTQLPGGGGSVVVTGPEDSALVVTGQTYSRETDGGTKGQFVPGVTAREAVGFGDRALEVLQLEQSPQYRSNVGFVEVTGKPAVIEIVAHEADTKQSVITSVELGGNEYRQFDRILEQMGLGTVYNGRVSIKVLTGEGRVYAYGSTVDNRTEDPTYVPAQ